MTGRCRSTWMLPSGNTDPASPGDDAIGSIRFLRCGQFRRHVAMAKPQRLPASPEGLVQTKTIRLSDVRLFASHSVSQVNTVGSRTIAESGFKLSV
jgi:hypothetical protein